MDTVTFGASGLDRAAHLRADAEELARLLSDGAAVLPVWRGKPLADADGALVWTREGSALLDQAGAERVFLGLDDGQARFAADISGWTASEAPPSGVFFDPSVQVHPDAPDGSGFHELRGALMPRLSARDAELAATAKAVLGWHVSHRFCAACGSRSIAEAGGWQRICPSCGTRHFPRTDPVVIMLVTHGDDLLLGRSPAWPEGMYSLLAGFVEPGETLEAAAAREVFEETGVRLGPVSYVAGQPWPFPASLMVGMRAEALTRDITLDPVELDDALWLSKAEVLEAAEGRHAKLRPPRRGAIAQHLIEMWLSGRVG
ncbi:NAD(+) diphosphatase [Rhodobacterales bacterium HKCCE2091]|nr:NAD(+) diphosphatase [Rhodobacterales bacterium HKCCE2091]